MCNLLPLVLDRHNDVLPQLADHSRGSSAAGASTYEPKPARIAVIDRDNNAEHVTESLRSYLALDGEIVDIDDDFRIICSRLSHRIMLI